MNTEPLAPKAVATLQSRMVHYRALALEHLTLCSDSLSKFHAKPYTHDIMELDPDLEAAAVNFLAFHKNVLHFVDAATKLINYESPKLSQVDVTRNVIKRHVMVIPGPKLQFEDEQEWLAWVQFDQRRLEALKPTKDVSIADLLQKNDVEDAEEVV